MPALFKVTLGAFPDRGLPREVEYWTERPGFLARIGRARALGRSVMIERWSWAAQQEAPESQRAAA